MDRRKAMVRDAYNAIAGPWGRARRESATDARERSWLEQFFAALPHQARVLDLGCGSGAPILVELVARGYRVTGVDFSREQVVRARTRCPGVNLLQADLAELDFAPASFDGVIAYDSLWHVPREEHPRVFERMRNWLVTSGAALLTLGAVEESHAELFTDLMGAPVFYDAWPKATSLSMLEAAGFSIVGNDFQPVNGSRPTTGHLIVLAAQQ